jgi:hypothetical protein
MGEFETCRFYILVNKWKSLVYSQLSLRKAEKFTFEKKSLGLRFLALGNLKLVLCSNSFPSIHGAKKKTAISKLAFL